MKKCKLVLPDFELLKRQPKVPNVAHVVARRDVPNEHSTPITFVVREARNRKSWWIYATLNGMRMSNTISTAKPDKAQAWIKAVERGEVCLKPSD